MKICKNFNIKKITTLWNKTYGEFLPIKENLLTQQINNYKGEQIFYSNEEENSLMCIKKNSSKTINIAYIISKNEADFVSLLDIAIKYAKKNNIEEIHYGKDYHHLLPGFPKKCQEKYPFMQKVFIDKGFKSFDSVFDLRGDLNNINFKAYDLNFNNFEVCKYQNKHKQALKSFLSKCFQGRWQSDILESISLGYKDLLILLDKEKVIGFTCIYDKNSGFIGNGLHFQNLLNPNYGALGPIGIDKEYRGLGLGLKMLVFGLKTLHNKNIEDVIIDWTDLLDFYKKVNFYPFIEFIMLSKKISIGDKK